MTGSEDKVLRDLIKLHNFGDGVKELDCFYGISELIEKSEPEKRILR